MSPAPAVELPMKRPLLEDPLSKIQLLKSWSPRKELLIQVEVVYEEARSCDPPQAHVVK